MRLLFAVLTLTVSHNIFSQPYYTGQAYSTIVGVSTVEIKQGVTLMSLPYRQEPVYSGCINSINANILSVDPSISPLDDPPEQDVYVTTPHYVYVHDSIDGNEGMYYLIIRNDGYDITIDTSSGSPTINDNIHIIPANTIDSIFGEYEDNIPARDTIMVWNSFGWSSVTYFPERDVWRAPGTRRDGRYTIIYPDEGIAYIHRSADPIIIATDGEVRLESQLYIPQPGNKFISVNPFPTSTSLLDITEDSLSPGDYVYRWNTASGYWDTYTYDAQAREWYDMSSNQVDVTLRSHESFFIVKNTPSIVDFLMVRFK